MCGSRWTESTRSGSSGLNVPQEDPCILGIVLYAVDRKHSSKAQAQPESVRTGETLRRLKSSDGRPTWRRRASSIHRNTLTMGRRIRKEEV
ncbi:hypothetical protein NDU88_013035 [Pleurodeles waltl]|uniref:Uncharacterized protein n=1 Tax=Pleurodeles waltl TaxID=8319 RepID=A0AAV7R3H3_PLEWA|nr:hypothetical protein NDU88_013035 [Pleurodeles waltl]